MKIEFEGHTWTYDADDITVEQAEVIEREGPWQWAVAGDEPGETTEGSGTSVDDWSRSVWSMKPRAFRVLYWLMRAQNGEAIALADANPRFTPLISAWTAAVRDEMAAQQAAQGEPDPTRPPGTPPIPAGQPSEPPSATSSPQSSSAS